MWTKNDKLANQIVDSHYQGDNFWDYQNNIIWHSANQWGYQEEGYENPFQEGTLCWALWHVGYFDGLMDV